jgi:hypothetical protein
VVSLWVSARGTRWRWWYATTGSMLASSPSHFSTGLTRPARCSQVFWSPSIAETYGVAAGKTGGDSARRSKKLAHVLRQRRLKAAVAFVCLVLRPSVWGGMFLVFFCGSPTPMVNGRGGFAQHYTAPMACVKHPRPAA